MSHTKVVVHIQYFCDMCHEKKGLQGVKAKYDAKTIFGPWANLCEECFHEFTLGKLGLGIGQELIYEPKEPKHPVTGLTVGDILNHKEKRKEIGICSMCRRMEYEDERHNHPCE